jgi:hypothetical protein
VFSSRLKNGENSFCHSLGCREESHNAMRIYEVRPRKDKRGVNLISDVLPFGGLWFFPTTPHNQEPQRGIGPHCGSLIFISDLCDLIVVEAQTVFWCHQRRRLWRLWLASGHGFWRSFFSFSFHASFLFVALTSAVCLLTPGNA